MPMATDDTSTTDVDTPVTIDVLSNDEDLDGTLQADTVTVINYPVNGTVITNTNGTIIYTPSGGFNGQDTFTYTVEDDQGAVSNTAMVTITVIDGSSPPAFQQDTGADGLVSIEAENYDDNVPVGSHSWNFVTPSGYSGTGAMQALPNNGTNINSGYTSTACRLDYAVNFVKTGIHYIWLRGQGAADVDDSLHVGLDGSAVTSSDRITLFNSIWTWSQDTMDGVVATINVATPGVHTINVWMREDGMVLDKLLLSNNAGYVPTGTGPAESARSGNNSPIASDDIATTDIDVPVIIDVLLNDEDIDGSLLADTVTISAEPTNGIAVANADGTITYNPGIGFYGIDNFRYTVQDNLGATSNEAVVVVTAPGLLFYDVFHSAASIDDWMVIDEGSSTSEWSVSQGEFQQLQRVYDRMALQETFHLGTYAYYVPEVLLSDYYFSAQARMGLSDFGEDIGIMFRYQNADNYYRLSLNSRNGYMRLEKKTGGIFETLAVNARGYGKDQLLRFEVFLIGSNIHIKLNGTTVFAVDDNSLESGTVALYCGAQTKFDNVFIAAPTLNPKISIASPLSYSVTSGTTLNVKAIASNIPANAEVEFLLDGTISHTATFTPPSTYTSSFTGISAGNHTVEAILKNEFSTPVANDFHNVVGVSGDYIIVIGDSNANGTGDNYSADNNTVDGHIISFQGWAANLTDLLNLNQSHANNIAFNEAFGGDESVDAAYSRIDSILTRHPGADKSLILLGTNDALSLIPTGDGCSGGDCDGTFKGNMQHLIDRNVSHGKEIWVALAPPIFGSGSTPFLSPSNEPINTNYIQVYNSIITSQLTGSGVQTGPDLYGFFLGSGTNRYSLFSDVLHFNGLGYRVVSYLWYNRLNPGSPLALPFIVENLALSTVTPFLKQNLLEIGDKYYVDEEYTITTIPSLIDDGIWIMTANADRNDTGSAYVSFDTDRSVTVFVAFDGGASSLPTWLDGFDNTGQTIGVTDPESPQLQLYSRSYAAGSIVLGGNMEGGSNGANSNYLVIIVPNE
ncbi:MAG: tandem-95 repeat protein [Pseudomonadota bacterium]